MDEKKFINSKTKRFLSLGKSLIKASGEYALTRGKMKVEEFAYKAETAISQKKQTLAQIKAAKELIQAMGTMKGGIMKLGQMLSITDDLMLPKEITDLFKVLQKDSSYMPKSQVDDVFKNSFNKLPSKIFKSFDYRPIAAASIGQVHKAKLPTGEDVAVKIQYPNIDEVISADLKNIDYIKTLIRIIIPGNPKVDPIVKELKKTLLEECDYEREKDNMAEFRKMLSSEFPNIVIPKTYEKFCKKQVLTMEFMEGDSFEDSLNYPDKDKEFLSNMYYKYYLFCLFQKRHIHSDPQHGNFLFKSNQMILLDFGSTKKLSKSFIDKYKRMIKSIATDDFEMFKFHMLDFGIFNKDIEDKMLIEFFEMIRHFYCPYLEEGKFPIQNKNPFKSFFDFAMKIPFKHRGVPHKNFVLMDRFNLGMFMKLKKWNVSVNWHEAQKKYF